MNVSAHSPEFFSYDPTQACCTTVVGQQREIEISAFQAFIYETFLETPLSCTEPVLPQAESYYPDVTSQDQEYMSGSSMTPDMNYYAEVPAAAAFPATLGMGEWSLPADSMPYAISSPTWDPTSSSLYMALHQGLPTSLLPQTTMSPLGGFASLSLQPDDTISPAMLQKSSYEAEIPYILDAPQLYSSLTPSSPSSSSDAWTSESDYADVDYCPPPSPKRASKTSRKNGKASSSSAQRVKKPDSRYSPYSAPSSPSSSSSSSSPVLRPAAVKFTTPRTRQVEPGMDVAEPTTEGPNAWACPHCAHVQTNSHLPDLRRHILTHYPSSRVHVCRGVRLSAAHLDAHGIEDFEDYFVDEDGEVWVGGCYRAFSRRDALLRHLRNPNVSCLRDVSTQRRKSGFKCKARN